MYNVCTHVYIATPRFTRKPARASRSASPPHRIARGPGRQGPHPVGAVDDRAGGPERAEPQPPAQAAAPEGNAGSGPPPRPVHVRLRPLGGAGAEAAQVRDS